MCTKSILPFPKIVFYLLSTCTATGHCVLLIIIIVNIVSACEQNVCPSGKWMCKNSQCVPEEEVCNGDDSDGCDDLSDEKNCELFTCLDGYIKCGDLRICILVCVIKISLCFYLKSICLITIYTTKALSLT